MAPGTKGSELLRLLKHEARHRFLSPTSKLFQAERAALKAKGYWRSDLLRWGEEAIAEGSAAYPFKYPELYGNLSKGRIVAEAAAYLAFVGGAAYGTYKVTEQIVEQPDDQ